MLIKNGYYFNQFNAITEPKNYDYYENYDRHKTLNVSGIDKMCSFCLINTVHEDVSTACKCNGSSTVFPSSIATKTEYTPQIPIYENTTTLNDSASQDSMESSYSSNETSVLPDHRHDVYSCCFEFKGINPGDLDIKYGEKVRIIYSSENKQYYLVQMLVSGKCGYVPAKCLTTLNRFMSI
jgi:hypothetical protein